MNWFFWSVACAIFFGFQGLYTRFLHIKKISNSAGIFFGTMIFAIPILFIPALIDGFTIQKGFWTAALLAGAGNTVGFYSYIKSLELSEASLIMPILAISPIFVIPVSAVLLGEKPSLIASAAIALIAAGCWILTSGKNLFAPFEKFKKEKGIGYAALTLLMWAFVATVDKIALRHSSFLSYPFFAVTITSVFSLPFLVKKVKLTSLSIPPLALSAFINSGNFLTHFLALSSTQVAYLISVKRSGILVSVIGGILLFKEKEPVKRIASSLIIVFGNILLYLFG